jgi:uncharacterized protein
MPDVNRWFLGICCLISGCLASPPLRAQTATFPPRPGDIILDEARLIEPRDQQQIRAICERLLSERQVPIVVVTISSLADYDASDIETYARALFDHWGIGSKDLNWGILLLVSLGNRKARIELGADYAHGKDETARMIMQEIIIPNFKKSDYSEGIFQGVQALDTMARGLRVSVPRPWWHPWAVLGGFVLALGAAISLIRSGNKGWGYALLAAIFFILGVIFVMALRGRGRSGAFGGGFGGGGGATGSW